MFEQYIQMKEEKRKNHIYTDGFDTLIRNLPEIKSKLDEAKSFASGLLKKAGQGIEKTKNQLSEQNRSFSSHPSMESSMKMSQNKTQASRRHTAIGNSVIIAKEINFEDDIGPSESNSSSMEKARPSRPPPPRPPAPMLQNSTCNGQNNNTVSPEPTLISFDSPPVSSPQTLDLADNFDLLNKYTSMSLNQKSVNLISGTQSISPKAPPRVKSAASTTSWLHSNLDSTRPKSDIDEFDPLA